MSQKSNIERSDRTPGSPSLKEKKYFSPDEYKERIKRLSTFRAFLEYNQHDMAKELEISKTQYSSIELGRFEINIPQLMLLVKKHSLNAEWYLYGDGPMIDTEKRRKLLKVSMEAELEEKLRRVREILGPDYKLTDLQG